MEGNIDMTVGYKEDKNVEFQTIARDHIKKALWALHQINMDNPQILRSAVYDCRGTLKTIDNLGVDIEKRYNVENKNG